MPEQRKLERTALCCGLLALITLAVYLPVLQASFITFDDAPYITDNIKVQSGLTWEGLRWAMTQRHAANWHPLSWLSHMLDCQVYGLRPAGHHLTNLLLHTADTLLLFGLLRCLTGAFWRSAFVAALFALHPLHVESVAWVAERKDVLSTFFFLLTLWAYARYATNLSPESRVPSPKSKDHAPRTTHHAPRYYVLALLCLTLGLMSKPMLVTVPFVLLLLDYWPLRRLGAQRPAAQVRTARGPTGFWRLAAEKLPFLVLAAASCVVTIMAQRKGGAVASLEGETAVSLESRLVNTPISYAWYLLKLIWPSDLAVIYPYVRQWPLEEVLLCTALVLALTGVALWQGRRRPYVLVGWLWYLGTLVPVIGLVKVGVQSIADRYMYIPSIGLFVILAWCVADLTASWAHRTVPLAVAAAVVLLLCALRTGAQLLYWQNTETLFRHTLAVTQNNYLACNNLGVYFGRQGVQNLAMEYYRAAISIAPKYFGARNNLGAALVAERKYDEAISMLEEALRLNPKSGDAESNLGAALYCVGKTDEAIAHLRKAVQLSPDYALARYNLGNALLEQNRVADAIAEFRISTRLNPLYPEAHNNLALALARQGKLDDTVAEFRQALALAPALIPAHYGLGEALLDQGKRDQALVQFSEVLRLSPNHQPSWFHTGLLRAEKGQAAEAAEAFAASLRLKPNDPAAQCHLAAALASQHKVREAVVHYREALKLLPDSPEALNNLAWILAADPDPQVRNGKEAVELAERACKLTDYKQPLMIGTLAAAYAEAGRFPDAVATAEQVIALAERSDQTGLAARNRELLALYRSGKAVRDNP